MALQPRKANITPKSAAPILAPRRQPINGGTIAPVGTSANQPKPTPIKVVSKPGIIHTLFA